MPAIGKATYGIGTLFKRGRIWYLSYYVKGRQVQRSPRSTNLQAAKRLRNQILGKKARGEMGNSSAEKVTCGEVLDDLIEYAKTNGSGWHKGGARQPRLGHHREVGDGDRPRRSAFPAPVERHVRQGFLVDDQYEKLRDALPDYLKPLFIVGYFTGRQLMRETVGRPITLR